MEIMKLIPTGKDYLWGGTRLREEYGKKIDLTPLAETWECSVHRDGPSYVANGTYKGKTLAEVLKAHPEYLGTKIEDLVRQFQTIDYEGNYEGISWGNINQNPAQNDKLVRDMATTEF